MKTRCLFGVVCTATFLSTAQAQWDKQKVGARNDSILVIRKATVAQDKITRSNLRDQKEDDKVNEDIPAVRADRKALRKAKNRLLKNQIKKDIAQVKAKI